MVKVGEFRFESGAVLSLTYWGAVLEYRFWEWNQNVCELLENLRDLTCDCTLTAYERGTELNGTIRLEDLRGKTIEFLSKLRAPNSEQYRVLWNVPKEDAPACSMFTITEATECIILPSFCLPDQLIPLPSIAFKDVADPDRTMYKEDKTLDEFTDIYLRVPRLLKMLRAHMDGELQHPERTIHSELLHFLYTDDQLEKHCGNVACVLPTVLCPARASQADYCLTYRERFILGAGEGKQIMNGNQASQLYCTLAPALTLLNMNDIDTTLYGWTISGTVVNFYAFYRPKPVRVRWPKLLPPSPASRVEFRLMCSVRVVNVISFYKVFACMRDIRDHVHALKASLTLLKREPTTPVDDTYLPVESKSPSKRDEYTISSSRSKSSSASISPRKQPGRGVRSPPPAIAVSPASVAGFLVSPSPLLTAGRSLSSGQFLAPPLPRSDSPPPATGPPLKKQKTGSSGEQAEEQAGTETAEVTGAEEKEFSDRLIPNAGKLSAQAGFYKLPSRRDDEGPEAGASAVLQVRGSRTSSSCSSTTASLVHTPNGSPCSSSYSSTRSSLSPTLSPPGQSVPSPSRALPEEQASRSPVFLAHYVHLPHPDIRWNQPPVWFESSADALMQSKISLEHGFKPLSFMQLNRHSCILRAEWIGEEAVARAHGKLPEEMIQILEMLKSAPKERHMNMCKLLYSSKLPSAWGYFTLTPYYHGHVGAVPLPGSHRQAFFKGLLQFVRICSELGVSHNDMHTGNIIYNSDTQCVTVIDWEFASRAPAHMTRDLRNGKKHIYPPEYDERFIERTSDTWFVGILLAEALIRNSGVKVPTFFSRHSLPYEGKYYAQLPALHGLKGGWEVAAQLLVLDHSLRSPHNALHFLETIEL